MKAREVAKAFERIAPKKSAVQGDEVGFIYGDPEREVTGVGCVWQVQPTCIEEAVSHRINLLICHESLWLPDQESDWYERPKSGKIFVNRHRKDLLDRHDLVVYRSHSNWDALPGDGVPDQAVEALSLPGIEVVAEQRFFRIHKLPQTITIREFYRKISNGLGYGGCRLFGNPEKEIQQFAFLIGGFGENQWHMAQSAYEMGAEAIILGEMSEFIVMSCLEMGMPVIETLHSVSEIPAIRRQAEVLSDSLLGTPVVYIPSGATVYGCKILID